MPRSTKRQITVIYLPGPLLSAYLDMGILETSMGQLGISLAIRISLVTT